MLYYCVTIFCGLARNLGSSLEQEYQRVKDIYMLQLVIQSISYFVTGQYLYKGCSKMSDTVMM